MPLSDTPESLQEQSKISNHQIVNIFRAVAELISVHPELLKAQGVFRMSGSKSEVEQLFALMIENDFNVEILTDHIFEEGTINSMKLFNVLGLLPLILKNKILLSYDDAILKTFSHELDLLLHSGNDLFEQNSKAAQLLDNFINSLLLSHNIEHQRVGEILYHYCYLMHTAANFYESNLMNSTNMAIILAPHFTSELELFISEDLVALTQFTMEILTPALTVYLESEMTRDHFKVRHADKLEHLTATRLALVEKLKEMKEASRKIITDPIRNLMLEAKNINSQIREIEAQLQDSSLKRKDKRALMVQLDDLKEEYALMTSQIVELNIQVGEMNDRHSSIHTHIRALNLSSQSISYLSVSRHSFFTEPEVSSSSSSLAPDHSVHNERGGHDFN